jgi:hypothetical protein
LTGVTAAAATKGIKMMMKWMDAVRSKLQADDEDLVVPSC